MFSSQKAFWVIWYLHHNFAWTFPTVQILARNENWIMRYQSEIEAIILHVALIHFTELFQWNSFILLKDYKELSIWRCSASERDRHPIVLGTQRMIATRMCSAPEVLAPPRCLPPTKRKKMNQGGYVTNGAYNQYSFPPDPDHIFNSWKV